nr:MAG TPA: hypothetical protein [Bacteriophage sp.]
MKKKLEEKDFYTSEEMKEIFAGKESFWNSVKYFPWRLGFKIKNLYYQVKYGFQRMFRGYDDTEVFNMDMTFIDRYLKILKDFRKNNCGYPPSITNEQWDDILDEMIKHLSLMTEDNAETELKKGMPDSFEPDYKTVSEIMDRHKDEFFKLFSKWFYNLWD